MALSVGVFNLVQKAYKQHPVKLYRETNEPVKTKTRIFNRETGSLLLPSDTKRAQVTYLKNLFTSQFSMLENFQDQKKASVHKIQCCSFKNPSSLVPKYNGNSFFQHVSLS